MAQDLVSLTADLVAVASVSRDEGRLADVVHRHLEAIAGLEVTRVGDNVVARTQLGRPYRVLLVGHLDTVPPNGNEVPRREGDRLFGLGSTDMKSGLAVMWRLAEEVRVPALDVTYVFYAREEIARVESGLRELFDARPDLLEGDVALLGEPTRGGIEAGCQGTMRVELELRGARAHTARPWMGNNAIHRLAGVLDALVAYDARRPVIGACEYREAVQAVSVSGGVAANVVPDSATVVINHRFAPDRSEDEAFDHLRSLLAPFMEDGDRLEVADVAPAAPPSLEHPVLAALIERNSLPVEAKLGWTDVSTFAAHGIPATNFGPGDATIAHTAGEYVDREPLERVHAALRDLLERGV